jgi:hypothetical protein
MPALDRSIADLIRATSFAILTSFGHSGWPHSTVMWIDDDPEHLLINTRTSRRHYGNLVRNPKCTVVILDPETPYHYGVVQAILSDTVTGPVASAHIHTLSQRYRSEPYHTAEPSDRIILRLSPISQRDCWSARAR